MTAHDCSDIQLMPQPASSMASHRVDAKRISVHALTLTQFRNYSYLDLQTDARCVVLTGHNGAGKTNILEALSLLSPGRGFRKAKLGDITHAKGNAGAWVVAAECDGLRGAVQIGTAHDTESSRERRIVKMDGERLAAQTELSRHLAILWQTPQMDGLFLGGASERRKFLDRLVYNFDSEHLTRVNAYEFAMRERNKLLATGSRDDEWLHVLEARMSAQGVAIAAARNLLVERLNHAMMASDTGFPKAHLAMRGAMEEGLREGEGMEQMQQQLAGQLASGRRIDAAAGRTLKGVHRSELGVLHLLKNMEAAFCSTGEQKAMLLSMLLAHARARKEWQGAAPILLLDEVVAHLDTLRRKELFAEIDALGTQAWLTGTDAADFSAAGDAMLRLHVSGGAIQPL